MNTRPILQAFPSLAALVITSTMACTLITASAQSTTTPPPTTQNPTGTSVQNQTQGWTMFDDRTTKTLSLEADQLKRLQDLDKTYQPKYDALGRSPWTQTGYAPLTDNRNRDIQRILTPEQNKIWMGQYSGLPATPQAPAHQSTGADPDAPKQPTTTP